MTRQKIMIRGMSCDHCVRSVQRALAGIDGVTVEQVKVGEATVSVDPGRVPEGRLAEAVRDAGYEVVHS